MSDVYALFTEASGMRPEARAVWLDSLRLSASERGELDELIREHEDYEPGLTKVRTLILGTVAAAIPDPRRRIGRSIGPWRLERLVVDARGRSAGNMGHVYFAQRVDGAFEQSVAIKFIQSVRDDLATRERFIRERLYMGRLKHAHIVRILDAGSLSEPDGNPDGGATETPYYVMEWVENAVDISSRCLRGDMTVTDRVRLFCGVCEAVAWAHTQGVVHRDLKPQNVLVDASGAARLLDFGISSVAGEDGDATLLRSAMTLAYASPEQLAKGPVGPASDIYSLGVILYEILAGRRPYEVSGSWEADRAMVESISIAAPGAGFDLDHIVLKALARDLDVRYRHVDQLTGDLRRYLRREPVRAATERLRGSYLGQVLAPGYWLLRYARKYLRALAIAALVLALALAAGAWFGRRQYLNIQALRKAGSLAAEAALALDREEYDVAASLALESAVREPSAITRSVLQRSLPHLPRRVYSDRLAASVHYVAFLPDRKSFIALREDGDIEVRPSDTFAPRLVLKSPGGYAPGTVPCFVTSPDGQWLARATFPAGIQIWNLRTGKLVVRSNAALPVMIDCSSKGILAGLRYNSAADWGLMLTSGDAALWIDSKGEIRRITDALGCAPVASTCLRANGAGVELISFPSARAVAAWNSPGLLSPDGRWLALLSDRGGVTVHRLTTGRDEIWSTIEGSGEKPVLIFESSGDRLLLDDGEHRKVHIPSIRSTSVRESAGQAFSRLDPISFFLFGSATPDRLTVTPGPLAENVVVPHEGSVTVEAGEDRTGTLLIVDNGGFRLTAWRLPQWPGFPGDGASVLVETSSHASAVGWNATGTLVRFSPVDGTVETTLGTTGEYGPFQTWPLADHRVLARAGTSLSVWDPIERRILGAFEASVPDTLLATDPQSKLLAVSGAQEAVLLQLPSLRILRRLPHQAILAIAADDAGAPLLLSATEAQREALLLERVDPVSWTALSSLPVAAESIRDLNPSTLRTVTGTQCAGDAGRPGKVVFGMRMSRRLSGTCAAIVVDGEARTFTVESLAPSSLVPPQWFTVRKGPAPPGTVRIEAQPSEGTATREVVPDEAGAWAPTADGIAVRIGELFTEGPELWPANAHSGSLAGGSWRNVPLKLSDLRRLFCEGHEINVPPELRRKYELDQFDGCRAPIAFDTP